MKIFNRKIRFFSYEIDLINLISGSLIFISMLLYGLLKVSNNVRGVTLIFGRGNNKPQWFAILPFVITLITGAFLVINVFLEKTFNKWSKIEPFITYSLSTIIIITSIVILLTAEIINNDIFSYNNTLGLGAILSGPLLFVSGILLLIKFISNTSLIINKKLKTTKNKKRTIGELIFEIEKLGNIVVNGIQISGNNKTIIDLVNLYWNYNQIANQLEITDDDNRRLKRESDRMTRYIKTLDLEVNDYSNRVYNNMNVEILSVETDNSLAEITIIKTIEPEIRHNNIIIQKSKVILAGPNMGMRK